MELIADILLIAGAAGAAFYCVVLSRRLSRFNNLEQGMGGAIAVLSAQVDEMTKALGQAQGSAHGSAESLERLTDRAEDVAKRLELLVASMHDLPEAGEAAGDRDREHTGQMARPGRRDGDDRRSDREVSASEHDEPDGDSETAFRTRRNWREAAE